MAHAISTGQHVRQVGPSESSADPAQLRGSHALHSPLLQGLSAMVGPGGATSSRSSVGSLSASPAPDSSVAAAAPCRLSIEDRASLRSDLLRNEPHDTHLAGKIQALIKQDEVEVEVKDKPKKSLCRLDLNDVCFAATRIPPQQPTGVLREVLRRSDVSLDDFTLGQTPAAKMAHARYIESRGATGEMDLVMVRALSAVGLLHASGDMGQIISGKTSSGMHEKNRSALLEIASAGNEIHAEYTQAYGLSEDERLAIKIYTLANKDHIMPMAFDSARAGWQHLDSAMNKLPSTGDLGLVHTGFRFTRKGEGHNIQQLDPGARILHGAFAMGHGQHHSMSIATTFNVHTTPTNLEQSGFIVAMSGTSGRFIGPLGGQSLSTDGAEVLYPPMVHSLLSSSTPVGSTGVTVYALTECAPDTPGPGPILDDFNYRPVPSSGAGAASATHPGPSSSPSLSSSYSSSMRPPDSAPRRQPIPQVPVPPAAAAEPEPARPPRPLASNEFRTSYGSVMRHRKPTTPD